MRKNNICPTKKESKLETGPGAHLPTKRQPQGIKTREGWAIGRVGNQKHEVASSVEGQPQGGRRNQSGMRTQSQALRALRGEVQGDG